MAADPTEPHTAVAETERLVLRRLTLEDAPFMLALLTDEAFVRNVGDRGVKSLEDARTYLLNGSIASYAQHGFGFWCVVERASGVSMGICGLARRETLDDVDIGFAFLPDFRAQGYAHESAGAVMQIAREVFGLRRIVAITSKENRASAALLEKIGLRFERMLRVGDEDHEIRLFAWSA